MKIKIFITLIIISVIFYGCSSSKEIDKKSQSSQEIQTSEKPKEIEKPKIEFDINSNLKNLYAIAESSISLQGNNYSADLEIKIADDDSISIIVTGAFGMTYGKVYSTQKLFVLLNAFAGKIYTGNPQSKQLTEFIGTDLSISNLIDIFKAKLLFDPNQYKFVESKNDENKFEYINDKLQDNVILDQYQRIKAYSRKDNGQDIFRVNYFYTSASKNNFNTLKSLKLFIPQAKSSLELNFESYNILTDLKTPFSFKIPKNATIEKFD